MMVRLDHLLAISLGGVPEDLISLVRLALLQLHDLLAEARRVVLRRCSSVRLLLVVVLWLLEILHNDSATIELRLNLDVHWRETHDVIRNFLRSHFLNVA